MFNQIKAGQKPSGNIIALDSKPAKVIHLSTSLIFKFEGKPITGINSSFKTALKNAGITHFHFIDLRHAFTSRLNMKEGDLKDVQEVLGHKTMTLIYAPLSQHPKKKAVNQLNGLTAHVS
jgi:integrase